MSNLGPRRPFVSADKGVLEIIQQMAEVAAYGGVGTAVVLSLWNKYRRNVQVAEDANASAAERVTAGIQLERDYRADQQDRTTVLAASWIYSTLRFFGMRKGAEAMRRGPLPADVEMANREAAAAPNRAPSSSSSLRAAAAAAAARVVGGNGSGSGTGGGGASGRPQLPIDIPDQHRYEGRDQSGRYWASCQGGNGDITYKYYSGPSGGWLSDRKPQGTLQRQ